MEEALIEHVFSDDAVRVILAPAGYEIPDRKKGSLVDRRIQRGEARPWSVYFGFVSDGLDELAVEVLLAHFEPKVFVLETRDGTTLHPESRIGKLATLARRYGLPVYFVGRQRPAMETVAQLQISGEEFLRRINA